MNELPLGYAAQPNPPKRPTRYDPSIKRQAAERLLPEIIQWLGKDWRETDREDYLADLVRVITIYDGYEAARTLERDCHWQPDFELVEILDGARAVTIAEDIAIKAWVEANRIAPLFAIGDQVSTKHGAGKIVAIDAERAAYVVQTAEFLASHPKSKRADGIVINFEEARIVATSESEQPEEETAP